jgi:ParB family chromosome partitioning protein
VASRNEFDDFFDDDEDAARLDTKAAGRLLRVPLSRISPNQVNPRKDFGTEDDLIDFGKSLARRQNQPCPVVTRAAYLKLWPDHEDRVGDVDVVIVSGERRYRAATVVGLPMLNCVIDDDFAVSRKAFMEAVVSENVDRQNFDPIEEAYAVQALVAEFGSNRAVAQHFERVDGWVTQRILLTHLAPDVQHLVRKKALPLESARSLGKLARDKAWGVQEQLQWWEEEQGRKAAAAAARTAARREAKQAPPTPAAPVTLPAEPIPVAASAARAAPAQTRPESFTAVKPPEPRTAARQSVSVPEPVPPARTEPVTDSPAVEVIPEPRHTEQGIEAPLPSGRTLPYDDGNFIGQHLIRKMPTGELVKTLRVLNEYAVENGLEVSSSVSG